MKKYLILARSEATEQNSQYGKQNSTYIALIGKDKFPSEIYLADNPMTITADEIHAVMPTKGIAFRMGYSAKRTVEQKVSGLNAAHKHNNEYWNTVYEVFPVELD